MDGKTAARETIFPGRLAGPPFAGVPAAFPPAYDSKALT